MSNGMTYLFNGKRLLRLILLSKNNRPIVVIARRNDEAILSFKKRSPRRYAPRDDIKGTVVDSKDIDENILGEFDQAGHLVTMTIEHAKEYVNVEILLYQKVL